MSLSPEWLDELRTRTSLSGLVRRTVKLQRAGNEWKACCPFHNEKSPSFYVNDAKGFYHCFGCGAHGDAIRWLTEQRGLAFMDAIKELAGEAGLELPAPDPAFAARAEQRASLHDVTQAAQDWFVANLATSPGARAGDYLKARGLDARAIERFGFGWAPDDRGALGKALDRFDQALLVEIGLLASVEDKEPYARFRGRITLPIQDARARVIGFGGRILEATANAPKYLNSPDTLLFDKGRTLYNLHRAGPAARKAGRVVVVEGYMDVVGLAAAGIEEAVAPMGTALTEQQLELLWRLADKPLLCFDGDAAGQRAAMRAITRALPLLQPGRSLEIVRLPAGMDPDDLVRRDGPAVMERLLAQAKSFGDYIWSAELSEMPASTPSDLMDFKSRLEGHAKSISNRTLSAELLQNFRTKFSELRSENWRKFRDLQKKRKSIFRLTEGQSNLVTPYLMNIAFGSGQHEAFTQAVLAGLARYPGEIGRHAEALLQLAATDPPLAETIDLLLEHGEALEAGGQSTISTPGTVAPSPRSTRFSFLVEGHDPDEAREDLAEAVTLLIERPALDAAIVQATARFDDDPAAAYAEQQRLRKRKLEIESRLGHLARKRAASATVDDELAGRT